MKGRSIVVQVIAGAVFVAFLSSVALAATAALTARILWESQQNRALRETARAFERSLMFEATEDGVSPEQAAPEALVESALAGYQVEVWRGSRLVAMNSLGPAPEPPSSDGRYSRKGWLLQTHALPDGLTLIVAFPEAHGLQAWRVFLQSLLLSMTPSLLLAIIVGHYVGRRATAPLVDFTRRVSRIAELRRLEPTRLKTVPSEVRELERSFHDLLTRLLETVSRELEFASNASHELRTPLTAIRLNAERALQDAGKAGRQELGAQIAEIDRMVRLIDSLLVMARDANAGMPTGEVVNVADVAREVARRVLANGSLAQATLSDEALVRGDENLLVIAVENLLDNAQKFTAARETVRMSLVDEGGWVRLLVTSPGARIPKETRDRIFERFYRDPETRATFPGHGLGLPLARHIARLHGGDVKCISGQEEDACFSLELPCWKPVEPVEPLRPVRMETITRDHEEA